MTAVVQVLRKRVLPMVMLVTGAAIVLAACGGDEGPTAAPTVGATPTAGPTAVVPAATPRPTVAPATPTVGATPTTGPTAVAPTATPRPTVAPAEQPKLGGTLRLRLRENVEPRTFDIYDARVGGGTPHIFPLFNNLVLTNPYKPDEVIPDLAESWTVAGGGTTLSFKVRPGVTWHDGRPFTSADVVYTYNRAISPPSTFITRNAATFVSVSKVEAPDSATVVLTMKRRSASFVLGIASLGMGILPQHVPIEEFATKFVGTGPFKLASRRVGIELAYTKNPTYWKKDARGNALPYLDGIHRALIADNAIAQGAFRTGQLDAFNPYDFAAAWPLLQNGALQREFPGLVHGVTFGGTFYLHFNQQPPFTDIRLRKAVHLAFDRQTHADANEPTTPPYPWTSPLITPELGGLWGIPESELAQTPGFRKDKTADVAEAKRLLREAGVDPAKLTIRVDYRGEPIAALLKEALGIDVKVGNLSTALYSEARRRGDFDIAHITGAPEFDDPVSYFSDLVVTGGANNFGKWSDAQLDSLLQRQEATLDAPARRLLLLEAQRRFIDLAWAPPSWYQRNAWAYRPYLKNQPNWTISFGTQWRFDQVWLDR